MNCIKQGTTQYLPLLIKDHNASEASITVTFKDELGHIIVKRNPDMRICYEAPDTVLVVRLSQQDTLALTKGKTEIDARWVLQNGDTYGTQIAEIEISEALLKAVIEYVQ